jgi:cell division protein ZapE
MHGPNSADATGGVAHLVDRQPTVSPERLIAQLAPPPTFAHVSFASYHPDPAEPTQSAGVVACNRFCGRAVEHRRGRKKLFGRREALPGIGLYLDGGFGVGKTHLLAAAYHQLPDDAAHPKAFATFMELTQLAGVFGFVECIDLLADYTLLCIDEFELDDPGNTTLISRLLSQLVERGVSVAATSNTLPEQLGEGRFAAQDFLREINTLAAMVCLTGVHTIEDQNMALRLVALTDRLYDAGIPVLASGEKFDGVFSEEMLAGGFRKKYLRATSRLLALTAAVNA